MRRSGVRLPSAPPLFASANSAAPKRSEGGLFDAILLRLYSPKRACARKLLYRQHGRSPRPSKKHNAGEVPHTSKLRPWRVKTAVAFTDKARASSFERFLKTASGRTFAKNRL